MKKTILVLAAFAAFGLTSLITFGQEQIEEPTEVKKPTIEVGDLCCHNFDGWCTYPDGVEFKGAFWV